MTCSFCGRSSDEVSMIPGPDANICVDCVNRAHEMVCEHTKSSSKTPPLPPTPTPKEIKAFLDQYVIGHDDTKKVLSVAVHNHYRRLESKLNTKRAARASEGALATGTNVGGAPAGGDATDVEIEKSNILLLGPTGTGKTLLARTLAKFLGVPFAIGDATVLTQAGYVGEDVENLVRYLLQNADGNVELARRGIIYVDEIDKIASKTDNVSITRDVGGEGVQQALLKIIEGTICRIPPKGGRKHPDQEYIEVDTSDILFICGGAFVGLDKIVAARQGTRAIGFLPENSGTAASEGASCDCGASGSAKGGSTRDARASEGASATGTSVGGALDVRPEDLVKFGLIPEFTGRLPVITAMKELTEDDLVRVLTEPKNSLVRQYQKLLAMDGVELSFEEGALRGLARKALERKTGARGLRAEMEQLMLDIMYEAPGNAKMKKVVISEEMVKRINGGLSA